MFDSEYKESCRKKYKKYHKNTSSANIFITDTLVTWRYSQFCMCLFFFCQNQPWFKNFHHWNVVVVSFFQVDNSTYFLSSSSFSRFFLSLTPNFYSYPYLLHTNQDWLYNFKRSMKNICHNSVIRIRIVLFYIYIRLTGLQ